MQSQDQAIYKIYSRKRFCFNKGNNPKKKRLKRKLRKIFPILIIIVISFSIFFIVWNSINPIYETLCKDEAKSIATKITNEETTLIMKQYNYDDFFTIQRDEDDNIKMVSANILNINEVTSNIAINIQQSLNDESKDEVNMALGSITGIKMLSGIGPMIKIKVISAGTVETNLKSEFIAQSINQTLHRVYLEIECKVNILTPYSTIEETIYNQVILAENVILGEIPSTHYNIEGLDENSQLLETLE